MSDGILLISTLDRSNKFNNLGVIENLEIF